MWDDPAPAADADGNVQIPERSVFLISGGRNSIVQFLNNYGDALTIKGKFPFFIRVTRKKKVVGKNETLVTITTGWYPGGNEPDRFQQLRGYTQVAEWQDERDRRGNLTGMQVPKAESITPRSLATALSRMFTD